MPRGPAVHYPVSLLAAWLVAHCESMRRPVEDEINVGDRVAFDSDRNLLMSLCEKEERAPGDYYPVPTEL